MGVYINMEMPKPGRYEAVIIVLDKSTAEIAISPAEDDIGYWKEYPLVPVPPHGRLGDLDALITTFCEWGTSLECKGKFVITMAEAKQTIVDIIEKATTIIPAEPPKEEQ